jgi:hypothetical protein
MIKSRNIYKETSIGKLQQGYIFNNATSEDYIGSEVYGIIITPRCDIDNEKVSTFHYLPVIRFEDWLLKDYWSILKKLLLKMLYQSVNVILDNNKISKNVVGVFPVEEIKDKIKSKIKGKKHQDRFCELIDWLKLISDTKNTVSNDFLKKVHGYSTFQKIGNNIIKDLTQDNQKDFYLIEDWEKNDGYYVILLREIQKINWELGMKIANGVNSNDLNDDFYRKNDIKNVTDGFTYPLIELDSPFIEHLIQKFFTNFGRVGINNHELNLHNTLIQKVC